LDLLWEEVRELEDNLDNAFLAIRPLLNDLENGYLSLLNEDTSGDWTDDAYTSEVNIVP